MQTIETKDVIIPSNRQRREFDQKKLDALRDGITSPIGLLQPIVLRDDHKTLVCGERRLRTVSALSAPYRHNGTEVPVGSIPYVVLSELSAELLHAAELEENVNRTDLTWQERARAIADLHKLRVGQSGVYNPGTKGGHSIKDTASEIIGHEAKGSEVSEISDAIRLAEFLDDPFVSAAKDEKEAKKIIREGRKHTERLEAAKNFDASKSPHVLTRGSSYDVNDDFHNLFDVIVTDPPYGIDIHKKEMFDGVEKHEYDDSDEAFQIVCEKLPMVAARTAKKDAHIYVFCDIRRFSDLLVAFEVGGWNVWNRPLIWDKGNTGSYGNLEHGFRACYDAILFAYRGSRILNAGYRDVININQRTDHAHPAGKPIELYVELLSRSCRPGDKVADFYCGSGPIFPAASQINVQAYGWEINEKYHAMSVERIEQSLTQKKNGKDK